MATVTGNQNLPIPQSTDSPDVPRDFKLLAEAIEKQVVMKFSTASDRSTKVAVPSAGMLSVLTSTGVIEFHNGSSWVQIYPPLGQPNHSIGSVVPSNSSGSNGDIFFKV